MLTSIYTSAYTRALTMLNSGADKNEILCYLTTAAENAAGPDTVASIMALDAQGLLRNVASPRLPADYLKAIDGIRPNANLGTCAAAAATGNIVVTRDFNADNKWAELRHLPTALGFVGAWSVPIKTAEHKVVGTFGTYFRALRNPSIPEIEGTQLLARAAAMVLHVPHLIHQ